MELPWAVRRARDHVVRVCPNAFRQARDRLDHKVSPVVGDAQVATAAAFTSSTTSSATTSAAADAAATGFDARSALMLLWRRLLWARTHWAHFGHLPFFLQIAQTSA